MFAHLQVKLIFSFITLRYLNIHKILFSVYTPWACVTCERDPCFSFIFLLLKHTLSLLALFQTAAAGAAEQHGAQHGLKMSRQEIIHELTPAVISIAIIF